MLCVTDKKHILFIYNTVYLSINIGNLSVRKSKESAKKRSHITCAILQPLICIMACDALSAFTIYFLSLNMRDTKTRARGEHREKGKAYSNQMQHTVRVFKWDSMRSSILHHALVEMSSTRFLLARLACGHHRHVYMSDYVRKRYDSHIRGKLKEARRGFWWKERHGMMYSTRWCDRSDVR